MTVRELILTHKFSNPLIYIQSRGGTMTYDNNKEIWKLLERYGDIQVKWQLKYSATGYKKIWNVAPVGRRIVQTGGRRIIQPPAGRRIIG
jgi:hypothetical protein